MVKKRTTKRRYDDPTPAFTALGSMFPPFGSAAGFVAGKIIDGLQNQEPKKSSRRKTSRRK